MKQNRISSSSALRRSLLILGTGAFTSISVVSLANPVGAQNRAIDAIKTKQRVPTANDLVDRDRLRQIANAKCDIQITWRYSSPGQHASGDTNTAGGASGSARARGRYQSGTYVGARPVFKNVGDKFCPKFNGRSGLMIRVDGAGTSPEDTNTYRCPLLSPGRECVGSRVIAIIPPSRGGGDFHAYTQRLRWDSNQRNNTYKLHFTTFNAR